MENNTNNPMEIALRSCSDEDRAKHLVSVYQHEDLLMPFAACEFQRVPSNSPHRIICNHFIEIPCSNGKKMYGHALCSGIAKEECDIYLIETGQIIKEDIEEE